MLNEIKSAFGGNKIKKFIVGGVAATMMLANTIMPAAAIGSWDVTGNYDIAFECTPDCGGSYTHDASLTQAGSNVTGNGGYPNGGGPYSYTWHITSGTVSGNTIDLTILYDTGATGTIMHMSGTIALDGSMSGVWDDDFGGIRNGTWMTTEGHAQEIEDPGITIPEQCNQETQYNVINGTNGSDNIQGTNGPDLIFAMDGSDKVTGNSGADCIVGGDGSDKLIGNNGDDVILGGAGSDSIEGNHGEDNLYGQGGSDSLKGGNDTDNLWGGADSDSLRGENGEDTLDGGDGSDSLRGGAANDTLTGGDGVDSANGESGNQDICDAESENNCEL